MCNIILPNDLENKVNEAARFFWNTRREQINRQIQSVGQGNRGAVTAGKQMDGFIELTKEIMMLNGIEEKYIYVNSNVELPGYYRPNKKWDMVVVKDGTLLAAIEFKSQVGPSFGNNFNNRTEEAMGSAMDIWTAYREGVFGIQRQPWLGYFMVLEDCSKSNSPVKIRSPHFNVMSEFENTSYKMRYELFCSKLLLERQYNATCFMTTRFNEENEITADCPNEVLSFKTFVTSLIGNIISV